MSRSRKKHPCPGWHRFRAKQWKAYSNRSQRLKNKQLLRKLLDDPEGDEIFVEDRWSLKYWIGEKYGYTGETFQNYRAWRLRGEWWGWRYLRGREPSQEEKERIIRRDWMREYLGK